MGAAERDPDGWRPGPAHVVVPDDASALEPDRLAWLAEQRAASRRGRLRRLLFTRRWERFGLSGPIVVLCVLVTALFGGLAVVLIPPPRLPEPGPAPLAAVPEVQVTNPTPPVAEAPGGGVLDRRLPVAALDGDARPVSAAELRPAVVVLVPPDCACTEILHAVYGQALEFRLPVWLVGDRRGGEAARRRGEHRGRAQPARASRRGGDGRRQPLGGRPRRSAVPGRCGEGDDAGRHPRRRHGGRAPA